MGDDDWVVDDDLHSMLFDDEAGELTISQQEADASFDDEIVLARLHPDIGRRVERFDHDLPSPAVAIDQLFAHHSVDNRFLGLQNLATMLVLRSSGLTVGLILSDVCYTHRWLHPQLAPAASEAHKAFWEDSYGLASMSVYSVEEDGFDQALQEVLHDEQ